MTSDSDNEIDAATLAARLDEGDLALIDVREPEEHQDERIPGSVLMPMSVFDPHKVTADHTGRRLVLYCLSGTRSARAAALLAGSGKPVPLTLRQGILGWKAAGLPTEGSGKD